VAYPRRGSGKKKTDALGSEEIIEAPSAAEDEAAPDGFTRDGITGDDLTIDLAAEPAGLTITSDLSFVPLVAVAARLYAKRIRPLAVLFGLIAFVLALLAVVGLTDLGRGQLFLVFLAQVAAPAFLGSVGMATASLIFRSVLAGEPLGVREALGALRPYRRNILLSSVFASMAALWSIILLGEIGFFLMPLFFGPPILIQVIALEGLPMRPARRRTSELLSKNLGRVLLYLFVLTLAVILIDTAVLRLTVVAADAATSGALLVSIVSMMQVVVAAFALPYLSAAVYVCYEILVLKTGERGKKPR
jgi:hypothetical protein